MKRREVITDEFGAELTKEELEEQDRIAEGCWEAVRGTMKPQAVIRKKPGRPKGSRKAAVVNKEFDDAVEEMIVSGKEEKEKIAPAQVEDPMSVALPEAVKNACVSRIEELEDMIRVTTEKIEEFEACKRQMESEYKVLTDFVFRKGK